MTSSLDAHSQFLPPELYEHLSASTKGRFAGIGIEINTEARSPCSPRCSIRPPGKPA